MPRVIATATAAGMLFVASPAAAQHAAELRPSGVVVARAASSTDAVTGALDADRAAFQQRVAPSTWSVKRWALTGAAVGLTSVLVYAMARCNRPDVNCNGDATLVPFLTVYGAAGTVLGGIVGGAVGLAVDPSR